MPRTKTVTRIAALLIFSSITCSVTASDAQSAADDWPHYKGDPGMTQYSTLEQINVGNVARLEIAWTYDASEATRPIGDYDAGAGLNSTMESNPLVVGGRLFFVSPLGRLICLDAETGRERWVFNPGGNAPLRRPRRMRGVAYWRNGSDELILFAFKNHLFALNPTTGAPIRGFGKDGKVDLAAGIEREPASAQVFTTTPGTVYKDLIIIGSVGNVPGHIRAFDIRTGKLRWVFHTIPHPGEFGYDTWPPNAWKTAIGANNWGGMSLDTKLGIVFAPLAFPKDYYGGTRAGDNLFANALVALDANTGRRLWHLQTVRHDLWDYDLPAAPTLVTVGRLGVPIEAVAQVTKVGYVYFLDRRTGESLYPLTEQPTLPTDLPGDVAAASQTVPRIPKPLVRQGITIEDLTRRTPEAFASARDEFQSLRHRGFWDPPSLQGTIALPGIDGGAEWGGAAYDPVSRLLYVNVLETPWILKMRRKSESGHWTGSSLYTEHCSSCHGAERTGQPPTIPSLVDLDKRMPSEDVMDVMIEGSGRMPAFNNLAAEELSAIAAYLLSGSTQEANARSAGDFGSPTNDSDFVVDRQVKFLDNDGYPAIRPPWGTLNAINVDTGDYVWRIPLGEYPELAAKGMPATGTENYGGPIVTAGGLLFIGATVYDNKFRAFDKSNGKLLWETKLPAAGIATPSTYRVNGRQFVVIAAGGGKNTRVPSGSSIVAFSLPRC